MQDTAALLEMLIQEINAATSVRRRSNRCTSYAKTSAHANALEMNKIASSLLGKTVSKVVIVERQIRQ